MIDIADKTDFATSLGSTTGVPTTFASSLHEALTSELPENTIVINAAGKEGAADDAELWKLIEKSVPGGTFVDIRPHLDIEIVQAARRLGWNAYTGHGMNARNDYVLLQGIARQIPGVVPPSFKQFERLVAQAS